MVSVSTANKVLKDYYLDAVTQQLNANVSPFFNAIEKSSRNIIGKNVAFTIVDNHIGGIGGYGEDSTITLRARNDYYQVSIPLKNLYGAIEITDKAVRASEGVSGSFVNVLNNEMEGLVSSGKSMLARMLYGDGCGTLCKITGIKDAHSYYVDNPKKFFVGMTCKFSSPDYNAMGYIKDVNLVDKSVMIEQDTSAATWSKMNMISMPDNEDYEELLGLDYLFKNAVLYGYNKDSNPYFRPSVKHIAPTELTEAALIEMIDLIEEESGSKVNMILCTPKIRRQIASLLSSTRTAVTTKDIAAGYSSIIVNDVPVYADIYCNEDRIYFLNTDDFVLCQLCDWSWLEDDNGSILQRLPDKAAYRATLVKYAELVCRKPCGQGAIYLDLSGSTN